MTEARPIEERLTEYAAAMRQTAEGLTDAALLLEAKYGKKASNTGHLHDGAKLYVLVAEDIDKIIAGEELRPFAVTGEI
jgi:hypothetical protein